MAYEQTDKTRIYKGYVLHYIPYLSCWKIVHPCGPSDRTVYFIMDYSSLVKAKQGVTDIIAKNK